MSDADQPPYWVLISVLFSSQPLTPSLAMTLHHAALELYREDESGGPIAGDLVSGEIRNLRSHAQLGTISGPAFEAKIETERGSGTVRFLLTREALELMKVAPKKKARAKRASKRRELLN